MATITLYADQMNRMPSLFTDIKRTVTDYKAELSALKKKTLIIQKSVCDLEQVMQSIQASTLVQEQKSTSLETFRRKIENFTEDVARIDSIVADVINKRKHDFYDKYSYLKPECEKSWLEKAEKLFTDAGSWCREHWTGIKAFITVVIVTAAVVILLCSGVGTLVGAIAMGALIGAGVGGIAGGIISGITGGSFVEGFVNGAFAGAIGGIIGAGMGFAMAGTVGLTLGQMLITGAVSGSGCSLVTDLADIVIGGREIPVGEVIRNMAIDGILGVAFAGIGYGMSKAFAAMKGRFWRIKGASGAGVNGLGNSIKSNTGKVIDTTPSKTHTTVTKNPGLKGEPNSSVDIMGKNGELSTRRWFDGNGNQIRDVDMTNHGNPGKHLEVPHEHGPR